MLKKCIVTLGLILATTAAPVFAAEEIFLTASPNSIDFSFAPNQAQVFTNAFPWVVKATCQITCDDNVYNQMQAKILKKNGTLNKMPLSIGDTMTLDIHNGDTFEISASSAAKVELKNTGVGHITASCFIAG